MAIIYRGRVGGNYQYWSENEPTPGGVSDITVVNVPVLTASHVDRSVYARDGISGSLQTLTGSQPYLLAGPNITVTTNSLGQVAITGSASGGGNEYWFSTGSNETYTTGSVKITGSLQVGTGIPTLGTDVNFFVSGAKNSKGGLVPGVGVFGGDVHVSGGLTVENSAKFFSGLSGSLTKLTNGSNYLIAGPNITVATNSLGQVEISGSAAAAGYWSSTTNNIAFTTGSVEITGSVTLGSGGSSRGLLNVGTLDISPITGSASTNSGTDNATLSGNVLSASNGVWNGINTVALRHEFHILGIGYDGSSNLNQFAATYLAMTHINAAGAQTAIGATELSRETTGSYVSGWDVNVNVDCSVAVTGSTNSGNVVWYVQRVKEMGLRSDGTRT